MGILGIIAAPFPDGLVGLAFPIAVNLLYWGFRIAKKPVKAFARAFRAFIAKRPRSYHLEIINGKIIEVDDSVDDALVWIAFCVLIVFATYAAGFYAFPRAVYDAVKNAP